MTEDASAAEVDAQWYGATYPDVALSGLSAAEHYRLVGQRLGRRARPDPARRDPRLVALAADLGALPDRPAARPDPAATSQGGSLQADGFPLIAAPSDLSAPASPRRAPRRGAPIALRLAGATVASVGDAAELPALWPTLALLCDLHGLDPGAALELQGGAGGRAPDGLPPAPPAPSGLPAALMGRALRRGPQALADLWFASTHSLRLLLGGAEGRGAGRLIRLHQVDPRAGGAMVRVGQGDLEDEGPTQVEAVLRNPLLPVLVELADEEGATVELGLIAFPSLARGGLHHAEIVALAGNDGWPATQWAFSAARLRERAARRAAGEAGGEAAGGGGNGPAVRLVVAMDGATGAEPIFSRAARDWLQVLGIPLAVTAAVTPEEVRLAAALGLVVAPPDGPPGPRLLLPPDALPTIAALLAGPGRGGAGAGEPDGPDGPPAWAVAPYLVAERGSGRPRWAVAPPAWAARLGALQAARLPVPLLLDAAPGPLPVAIRHLDPRPWSQIEVLLPTAPDRPPVRSSAADVQAEGAVACVATVSDASNARRLLLTLAAQAGADRMRLSVAGPREAREALDEDLGRLFPGRAAWIEEGRDLSARGLAELAGGDPLLLVEDRVLLHDPRTLSVLRAALAAGPGDAAGATGRVASAACVVLHEEVAGKGFALRSESGGFFPSEVGFVGGPHLRLDTPDTLRALPAMTYPVAANALSAVLLDPAALAEAAPILEGVDAGAPWGPDALGLDAVAFGLATLSRGWRHLCTSVVRASATQPRRRGGRTDPAALRALAPARWEELLREVTLLRELR